MGEKNFRSLTLTFTFASNFNFTKNKDSKIGGEEFHIITFSLEGQLIQLELNMAGTLTIDQGLYLDHSTQCMKKRILGKYGLKGWS